MIQEKDVYRIGRVGKPHGIKGEVQIQVDDDVFDRTSTPYLILRVDGILVPFFMEEYRFKSDEIVLVRFEDISSAEKARQLTGCDVLFPRHLAEAEEHDLTYAELVGYEVIDNNSGKAIGTIAAVDDTTENILFEMEDGMLIPAPDDLIFQHIITSSHPLDLRKPEDPHQMNDEVTFAAYRIMVAPIIYNAFLPYF